MIGFITSSVLLFGSAEATIHLPEGLAKALIAAHSGWRYIILILLVMAIIYGKQTASGKKAYEGATKKMGMFTMIAVDIQLLGGLVLYFFFVASTTNFKLGKLKDQLGISQFRSIAVEHAIGMLIALVLIHIGYSKAKKALNDTEAGKKQYVFYLIALIVILLSIPWPFLHPERGWF
jgi:heme A synthase